MAERSQIGVVMLLLLIAMSGVAGVLTTVAGAGGGLLLLLTLSAVWEPARALAVTAPALLVGNAHRAFTLRREADLSVARDFALGAFPAGLAGGLIAGAIPSVAATWLLVLLTFAAVLRALLRIQLMLPRCAILGSGAGIGLLTGTTGGAGMLVSPILLSRGLVAERYVATGAICGTVLHLSRICGYGLSGMFSPTVWLDAAIATAALLLGNGVGIRLRPLARRLPSGALEYGVLITSVSVALFGALTR